jgi:carbonic anhydrase
VPFAAVVGCADARVPVELIFSEGPNDLFVVRIAGNGLGDDVLGSLNYATEHLKDSLRTILVLGHSECGAVSAAVDVYLTPAKYLGLMTQKDLRHTLDRLLVVVQSGSAWLERVHGEAVIRSPGYRAGLIEFVVALNAALTANGILLTLGAESRSRISVLHGIYLLNEHLVWCPRPDTEWHGLAPAPTDAEELVMLCNAVAASPRIHNILNGG